MTGLGRREPAMTGPGDAELQVAISSHLAPLRAQRQQRLLAPDDDMWATFADQADWYTIHVDGETVGCCSLDDDRRLHGFTLTGPVEARGPDLLARAARTVGATAIVATTVDPVALAWGLIVGAGAEPVALMYRHGARATSHQALDMKLATSEDLAPAVGFYHESTGAPEAFLLRFLGERIQVGELHLVEVGGSIVAAGECRVDSRSAGYAHLGVVVGPAARGQGLATRVLAALAELARGRDLVPLCSTEPTNTAAQGAIRSSGFRLRHCVVRIAME